MERVVELAGCVLCVQWCVGVWQRCQQEGRAINDRLAAAAGVCGAVLGAADTVCRYLSAG